MDIVPVLDVKAGKVVRASGGRRDAYAPWTSPLSQSHDPTATLAALLRLWPFRAAYVADLDAIAGASCGFSAARLRGQAGPELWIDSGIATPRAARQLLATPGCCVVLGSESQSGAACLAALRGEPRVLLSLDFRAGAFLGPAALWQDASLWPRRVIVMSLDRVGEARGPDIVRLAEVVARAQGRQVHAAGGVRDGADLDGLAEAGAAGVLVATALHAGALGSDDIARHAGAGGTT